LALYPIFQHGLIEIQNQSDVEACDSQVRQKLRCKDVFHSKDALDFDDNCVFEQSRTKSSVHFNCCTNDFVRDNLIVIHAFDEA